MAQWSCSFLAGTPPACFALTAAGGGGLSHQLRVFPQQPHQPQGGTGFCLSPRCLVAIGSGSRMRKGWYLLAPEPQGFPEHCSPTQAFIFYRLSPC